MAWTFSSDSEGLYAQCTGSNYIRFKASGSQSSDMSQGAYYSWDDGNSQRGRCTFSDLPSFDLTKYKITKFRIYFIYSGGGNRTKSMSFYLAGTADSNYKITVATTSSAAYNDGQRSTTYTAETDINKLIASIQAGNKYLTAYNGETKKNATSGYSTNYCKMTSGYFRIYYEEIPPVPFHYYNGTSWIKPANVKYYNGTSWIPIASAKYYSSNGSLDADSWDIIAANAASGRASSIYSIGDIKYINTSTYQTDEAYLGVGVRIVDFKDYYISAEETRHGITFQFVNAIPLFEDTTNRLNARHYFEPSQSGFENILNKFYNILPYDLRGVMQPYFYEQLVVIGTSPSASLASSYYCFPPMTAATYSSTISESGLFIPCFRNYNNTSFSLQQVDNIWSYYSSGGSLNKVALDTDTSVNYYLRNLGNWNTATSDSFYFITQGYSYTVDELTTDSGSPANTKEYNDGKEYVALAFHV